MAKRHHVVLYRPVCYHHYFFFVSFLVNQFNVPFEDCNDWEKRVIKPKAKPQLLPLSSFRILWRNVLLLRLVKQYFNGFLKCADKNSVQYCTAISICFPSNDLIQKFDTLGVGLTPHAREVVIILALPCRITRMTSRRVFRFDLNKELTLSQEYTPWRVERIVNSHLAWISKSNKFVLDKEQSEKKFISST